MLVVIKTLKKLQRTLRGKQWSGASTGTHNHPVAWASDEDGGGPGTPAKKQSAHHTRCRPPRRISAPASDEDGKRASTLSAVCRHTHRRVQRTLRTWRAWHGGSRWLASRTVSTGRTGRAWHAWAPGAAGTRGAPREQGAPCACVGLRWLPARRRPLPVPDLGCYSVGFDDADLCLCRRRPLPMPMPNLCGGRAGVNEQDSPKHSRQELDLFPPLSPGREGRERPGRPR